MTSKICIKRSRTSGYEEPMGYFQTSPQATEPSSPKTKRQKTTTTTASSPERKPTPTSLENDSAHSSLPQPTPLLTSALHVLRTEALALAAITNLYQTSTPAQTALQSAVETLETVHTTNNKLLLTGVGKSSYIAQKLTATFKSLGIRTAYLHAGEALHGDLGDIMPGDALLLLSHSGSTPELLALLPHVPAATRVLALTRHLDAQAGWRFASLREGIVFLPAPVHESEECSFGVAAPTTSTTVALAVGDMLALTVAGRVWGEGREGLGRVFRRNHPGGAIGARVRAEEVGERVREGLVGVEAGEEEVEAEGMLPSPGVSESDDG
ncbi:hypothetical protein MBLNU230_g3720t1 [Neophaeotheca triangularis]